MDLAVAVAAGLLASRAVGYATMYVIPLKQWVHTVAPLVVTLSVAVVLTRSIGDVIVAVGLTEVVVLVVFILELIKDYLMVRNMTAGRR